MRAIRAAPDREVEVAVTRPTAPHLPETIELAARLRVRRATIRMPRWSEFRALDAVTLQPRLALAVPYVTAATRVPGIDVTIVGFPACMVWSAAATLPLSEAAATLPHSIDRVFCARCPGPHACNGVAREYVELFGWNELESDGEESAAAPRGPSVVPPPRAGRAPATRLGAMQKQSQRASLHGDPLWPRVGELVPDSILVQFDRDTASRVLRQRLVRAAQEGAPLLRIASEATFSRSDSPDLLRDAGSLSFARVELAGDARGLRAFSNGQLARLQFATRIGVRVFDERDEHEARETLRRVTELSGVPTFTFAVRSEAPHRAEWLWGDRRYTSFTRSEYDPVGDTP